MNLRSIDLFAGAGGMSEGLRMAGFECIWANEFDKHAAKTFVANFPSAIVNTDDIREISPADIRMKLGLEPEELDLIAGGPPCQGFSTYGQRDALDPRSQLYKNFFEFIREFRPKYFVMENVAGILSMSNGEVIDDVTKCARDIGYNSKVYSVQAEHYGVPQRRRRVFVIGSLASSVPDFIPAEFGEVAEQPGNVVDLFDPTHTKKLTLTVRDAISDLTQSEPLLPAETSQSIPYACAPQSAYQTLMREGMSELPNHSAKRMLGIRRLRLALLRPGDYGEHIRKRVEGDGLPYEVIDEILRGHNNARDMDGCRPQDIEKEMQLRTMLHDGKHSIDEIMSFIDHGGFKNKYRRLSWNEPSHTLLAHMARDCSDFVHPELDRFISVREAARLQSFPDAFKLPGSQFQQLKQLGNAVPPLLAKAVGVSICKHMPDHVEKLKIISSSPQLPSRDNFIN